MYTMRSNCHLAAALQITPPLNGTQCCRTLHLPGWRTLHLPGWRKLHLKSELHAKSGGQWQAIGPSLSAGTWCTIGSSQHAWHSKTEPCCSCSCSFDLHSCELEAT
jgi:hypothetical protein